MLSDCVSLNECRHGCFRDELCMWQWHLCSHVRVLIIASCVISYLYLWRAQTMRKISKRVRIAVKKRNFSGQLCGPRVTQECLIRTNRTSDDCTSLHVVIIAHSSNIALRLRMGRISTNTEGVFINWPRDWQRGCRDTLTMSLCVCVCLY